MRKNSARTVLLVCLIAASAASYMYLSAVSASQSGMDAKERSPQHLDVIEEERTSPEKEIILPDVHVIKKFFEAGKRLLPAS